MFEELKGKVERWSIERGLDAADPKKQLLKLMEELGELAAGEMKGQEEIVVDSVGDMLVVMVIYAQQKGLDLVGCLDVAYREIDGRKGKIVDGVFVKEEDL